MADSEIPSVLDEQDEDEATMMWNREDFEVDGELPDLPSTGPLPTPRQAMKPPPPDGSASALRTGLDEAELFSDVFDEPGADRPSAALPVQPIVDETGSHSIRVTSPAPGGEPGAEVEQPAVPSLVAPAPASSRLGVRVGVGLAALVVAAGLAYVFRAPLGLAELLEGFGLSF